jgi:OLD-like protein
MRHKTPFATLFDMGYDEGTLVNAEVNPSQTDQGTPRGVILVEGVSDRLALEALARRRGRDLQAEGISIVPMGGATNIRRFLDVYGPDGFDVRLAGLYDAGEEDDFIRALERAGLGSDLTRADLERLGFYACQADLEEELIRALGAAAVERVIEAQDELTSLRSLQNQPAWRGRNVEAQLRRFFGSKGSRKSRFGALLVEALDLAQVPRPLDLVLAHL